MAKKANEKKNIREEELRKIAVENSNSISLHDKYNNIVLNFQGVKVGNLIGMNAADIGGVYNWSPSRQALMTGAPVTGIVDTKYGSKQIVCANPILGDDGAVAMTVITALDKSLVDRYMDAQKDPNEPRRVYDVSIDYLSKSNFSDNAIVAESPQMKQVLTTALAVAATDSSVMLVGSSGTGKDVIARYIHRHSNRSEKALVPVNCAAIPQELMESEFFGYVKGAFTGANPQGKAGLFEMADKGTLFLDEIGDLPLNMQSKLLRVLETGEMTRLGDTKPRKVDVRLIAATNRDLKSLTGRGLFRSDLYFRINVIPITLADLSERAEDIIPLADGILAELNKKYGMNKKFAPSVRERFLAYAWPGNVRELRNVVERIVITSESSRLEADDRFFENPENAPAETSRALPPHPAYNGTLKGVLAGVEEDYIRQALDTNGGSVAKAAQTLGIHRSVLYKKLQQIKQRDA
ncbi:MAG: sigma 54-interacting transcriptional regulator [Clostridiales Family XIII bacterium]|jgi:transcriptional regulator with PAS, ATPase and Fis domain|nr:sigma 54-interacting transcriptional regulator [Clostridiales Family XIII bacterium]